jgi:hypothetical protein
LATAVRASLALLNGLAPDRFVFPLLGATYRAALGDVPGAIDLSLALVGPHGVGKSELAALAAQHYGAALDARHLPGSWSSTANALEAIAFAAKDALFVVDDYAPRGGSSDRQRLERDADRLLRAAGNRSGRQRMRSDGGLRPARPPRGLILSTGEDVPPGQSLRGRLLIVEISPGDVPLSLLSPHQRDASAGLHAQAMAGFVHWLAPQYGDLCDRLPSERSALREKATTGTGSARTPGIVADLTLGLKYFLDFAVEAGAITGVERDSLELRGWRSLKVAGAAQADHVQAAEPATHFLRLLAAAVVSGRAHVAGLNGREPEAPQGWGWRSRIVASGDQREEWQPQGRRIGWLDDTDLYLEPEAAYAAAQELARDQADGLPVTPRTIRKRLHERGLLASTDKERDVLTVRRTLEGKRRDVIHLKAACLSAERPDLSDQHPPEPQGNGQVDGRVLADPTIDPTTKLDQNPAANGQVVGLVGLVGSDEGLDSRPVGNSQPQSKRLRGSL